MLEPGCERVYTETEFHDCPRKGVADFEGQPHFYESEWDDKADDWASTFKLSPVEPRLLALALESWAIWRRWETAFHQGRTTGDTHLAARRAYLERPRRETAPSEMGAGAVVTCADCVVRAPDPALKRTRHGEAHLSVLQSPSTPSLAAQL